MRRGKEFSIKLGTNELMKIACRALRPRSQRRGKAESSGRTSRCSIARGLGTEAFARARPHCAAEPDAQIVVDPIEPLRRQRVGGRPIAGGRSVTGDGSRCCSASASTSSRHWNPPSRCAAASASVLANSSRSTSRSSAGSQEPATASPAIVGRVKTAAQATSSSTSRSTMHRAWPSRNPARREDGERHRLPRGRRHLLPAASAIIVTRHHD